MRLLARKLLDSQYVRENDEGDEPMTRWLIVLAMALVLMILFL
jgi:hypothetical protein